jgi:hypothetical protein
MSLDDPAFDLVAHLRRQQAFSRATFGPGPRTLGLNDHIRKELQEIVYSPATLRATEWVDVVILALDGLTRSLHYDADVAWSEVPCRAARMIESKQGRNELRTWPDWRAMPTDMAIEHDRSSESPAMETRHEKDTLSAAVHDA